MAEYNKVYASLKPELPKVIQQEQIYVYAPRSSRAGMKSISGFNITDPVATVQYDTTDGITVTGNSSLVSEEVSGETATQNFQSEFKIPIRPGKYIKIDATTDNDAVEVKVDDTALALDYIKSDKALSFDGTPVVGNGKATRFYPATQYQEPSSFAWRNESGDCSFNKLRVDRLSTTTGEYDMPLQAAYYGGFSNGFNVEKTSTDTGTLTSVAFERIKVYPNSGLKYDNKSYIRMDPTNAPNGTINYIHIDSIQNEQGGYKATGKCFSITVSTREWKVFDLEFSGSGSGNGIEQIMHGGFGNIQSVQYDTAHGARVNGYAVVNYVDSTTGMPTSKSFLMAYDMPIVPGKYVSMNATSDKKKIEVKVDDTALALDYYKVDKSQATSTIPYWDGTKAGTLNATSDNVGNSVVQRDVNGDSTFRKLKFEIITFKNGLDPIDYYSIYFNTVGSDLNVNKTTTDTGTLTSYQLSILKKERQSNNVRIVYDKQIYYRMYPIEDPNKIHNYIHIDSIQDGNGGYKAIGKCFSVNFSTGEWQVFDLNFGGSTPSSQTTEIYRHGITMNDANIVVKLDIYDSNSQNYTYEQLKAKLSTSTSYCANARIKRSDSTYYYSPATIAYWNDSTGDFALTYNNTEGNKIDVNWTPSVVSDNGTQIL